MTIIKFPGDDWDLLGETLAMDAESASVDYTLQDDLTRALNRCKDITPKKNHRLVEIPARAKTLVLTPREVAWLKEFLGPEILFAEQNDVAEQDRVAKHIMVKLVANR